MTFVAIHRSSDTSLATTRWHMTSDELAACESALDLLAQLKQLNDTRANRLDAELSAAREAGYAAGRDEALNAIAPRLIESWQRCADHAKVQTQALREAVVLLSKHVVQRIAASLAPADVVAALALRAAQDLVPARAVIVRVHPDLALAVQTRLAASDRSRDAAAVEVIADPGLDLLECDLETPQGRLIAGLDAQLDKAVRVLTEGAARPAAGDAS